MGQQESKEKIVFTQIGMAITNIVIRIASSFNNYDELEYLYENKKSKVYKFGVRKRMFSIMETLDSITGELAKVICNVNQEQFIEFTNVEFPEFEKTIEAKSFEQSEFRILLIKLYSILDIIEKTLPIVDKTSKEYYFLLFLRDTIKPIKHNSILSKAAITIPSLKEQITKLKWF